MPNTFRNKIIYGNETLIDLTEDTVTAADVRQGIIFHDKSGATLIGEASLADECDMYAGENEPTAAVAGDLWVEQSGGSGGVPLPSTITAGDTPVVINPSGVSGGSSAYNSLKATGLKITIPKTGNYRIKWTTSNAVGASSGSIPSCSSRLYKNGSAIGTTVTVNAGRVTVSTYNGNFNAGDVIEVWLKNGSSTLLTTIYHGGVSNLMACIDWDISKLWE